MKRFLALFLLPMFLFADKPAFVTQKDRDTAKEIATIRALGFIDTEIDSLHESISNHISQMKKLQDLGVDKVSAQYLAHTPNPVKDLFKKDSEGKTYMEFPLPQGMSYIDWPRVYIYDSVAFVYPKEDFSGLEKVIIMFKRVNSDGDVYVKEMRRIINLTPKSESLEKDEKGEPKLDTNSDIKMEFYQALTSDTIWPNVPIQKAEPNVVVTLNDEKDIIPYEKQRNIFLSYRKVLRKVRKLSSNRLHNLELDRKQLISKVLEF